MILLHANSPLPAALADRLAEEQKQAVLEAPRGQRVALIGQFLQLPDAEALRTVAQAVQLDVASNLETDPATRGLLPARLAHDYQVIPIKFGADEDAETDHGEDADTPSDRPLHVATAWPPDDVVLDWIRTFTPRPLVWHLAVPERVHQLIVDTFGVGSGSLEDSDDAYVAPEAAQPAEEIVDEDAAVVRFVSDVITQAIADAATDIHFEPQEGQLRIRYRVDGLLVPVPVPENLRRFQDAIISRLKIMARLNISEKRLPQDGRINFKAVNTTLDIRVSTFPTIYAESISLRLLNTKKEAYSMEKLGMSEEEQRQVVKVLDYPHGIILVTGPTGSGKSTSLNAFLRKINSTDLRLITIEDPIEYYHPHKRCIVTQREVHVDVPSFSEAIRRALRQDPDIILVGEMRDLETIEAAISAAETGHLVFGTLHTNSAAKTIDRIVDAFPANMKDMIRTQLASSLVAVISQVLCKRIGGGRIAGYEIMVNTTSIASLIRENKTFRISSDIQTGAHLGMITMDTHLLSLVNRELVNPDEALEKAQDPVVMREKLMQMGHQLRPL